MGGQKQKDKRRRGGHLEVPFVDKISPVFHSIFPLSFSTPKSSQIHIRNMNPPSG